MQDKRDFLFDILPKNTVCAEIGVWRGDFSQKILDHLNPQKLYLIDPWKYEPDYGSSWYGEKDKNQEFMDNIYSNVAERFKNDSKICIVRMSSAEAAKIFPDNYFNWIYLDANHTHLFVKQDLELFWPKIKNGGYLCGDDYSTNGWWKDGVIKAVDEFVEINKLKLFVENNQFIIKKEI